MHVKKQITGKQIRLLLKLLLIIILTVALIKMIGQDLKNRDYNQPQGTYISFGEILPMIHEIRGLQEERIPAIRWDEIVNLSSNNLERKLLYEDYAKIMNFFLENEDAVNKKSLEKQLAYDSKYKKNFYFLKEDWYKSIDELLQFWKLQDDIIRKEMTILCSNEDLVGNKHMNENELLLPDGEVFQSMTSSTNELKFTTVSAYIHDNKIISIVSENKKTAELLNIYIQDSGDDYLQFFFKGYEIQIPLDKELLHRKDGEQKRFFEQIADLTFGGGKLSEIRSDKEKISGKLLATGKNEIEIEGRGKYRISENLTGYQIFEELREASYTELVIGCQYYDFIIDDKQICSFLITAKEAMESVRIVIKDNEFVSAYHDQIVFNSDEPLQISFGNYQQRKQETISAGKKLIIDHNSIYTQGDRLEVKPMNNTGKIRIESIIRNQQNPEYRGKIEVVKTDKGFVLINDVLLEEYLYSVVPSEMPASYPIEALKAQAICARTYAYRFLNNPGYGELGAHMDDSVSYQVYNNIAEQSMSTRAVRETTGYLLLSDEQPADTFYYSTSCGYGRNQEIAGHHAASFSMEDMTIEENFRKYIMGEKSMAYEREEPWFRWNYQVNDFSVKEVYNALQKRYEANPQLVLTYTGKKLHEDHQPDFCSKEIVKFTKINNIICLKRLPGGVLEELLLETDSGIYKIISEYNIRAVLNQGGEITRQDGSEVPVGAILPSAYFVINIVKEDESVVGYNIVGGGYGHGIGMSQNGAKSMANENLTYQDILSFFYKGCVLQKIY